jgi:16S rRNA processing protein RimM
MEKEQCFILGTVSKVQGIKGKLIFHLEVDFPEDYSELESVYIENNRKLVPFFIEEIELLPKNYARVKLEDVDSAEAAQKLVKGQLYLPISELPELEDDQFYFHEIIDFTVVDEHDGAIGSVIEYLDIPANPQLLVNHNNNEILIPISDHFYTGIDKAKREIYVSLPPGLIDVNIG